MRLDVQTKVARHSPPRTSRFHRFLTWSRENILVPVGIFLAVLTLWELLVASFNVPLYTLPRPSEIIRSFAGETGEILHHGWVTMKEAVLGYLIGNGIALILAALMAEFRFVEKGVYPYVIL